MEALLAAEIESSIKVLEQGIHTINVREKEYRKEQAVLYTMMQKLNLLELDYGVLEKKLELESEIRKSIQNKLIEDEPVLKIFLETFYNLVPGWEGCS